MKKRNAKYLALFLALSMAVSPLSYMRAYAMDSEVEAQEATVEETQSTPVMEEDENTEETMDSVGKTDGEVETPAGEKSDVTEADITGADVADSEKSDIVENEASVDKEADASDNKETDVVKKENVNSAKEVAENTETVKASKETVAAQMSQDQEKEAVVPVQPTAEITELQMLKNDGTGYGMFPISDAKYSVEGDVLNISFNTGSKKVFDWLYLGPQTDAEKTEYYVGKNTGTTVGFSIQVPLSYSNTWIPVSVGRSDKGTWSDNYLWLGIPDVSALIEQPTAPSVTGDSVKVVKEDGYEFEMFMVSESSVKKNEDKLKVTFSTTNISFDKIYLGSKDKIDEKKRIKGTNDDGVWTFTFETDAADAGKVQSVVLGKPDGTWYTKQDLWMYIPSKVEETPDPTPTPDPKPTPNPTPTPDPKPGNDTKVPANGIYNINVTSSSTMFRVVDCALTAKNGKMNAILTLSGTGYGYLYVGTKEKAAKADHKDWIPYKEVDGKYTYEIPVQSLDEEIAVAAYSIRNKIWYDRMLTFQSGTLKKISDNSSDGKNDSSTGKDDSSTGKNDLSTGKNDSSAKPGNQNSRNPMENDGKADKVSKYEADTSGSTTQIDSSTALKDGVYTPDRFTWSGGTGKVQISCSKITVTNGQAYATLVFSSDHYQYVKVNGNTYYTTKGGGQATVVIPVTLNQNMKIIGMTDKMSVAHEIEYNIYIYLAAAAGGSGDSENAGTTSTKNSSTLDEKAPGIMGLTYQSETKLEYAQYFKIYHYDKGVILLEVDLTKNTARDPEKLKQKATKDSKKSGSSKKMTDKQTAVEEDGTTGNDGNGDSEAESAAKLYKENIVKYLLVPEKVEIPVGLDQDMIVVKLPNDKTYAASNDILKMMDKLEVTDRVAAVGMKKKDCKVTSVSDKITDGKKSKNNKDAQIVYAGKATDLKMKTLVKQSVNLVILPENILPQKDQKLSAEKQTKRYEELTEKLALLNIPVIIDRSADEKEKLAKAEWIKVYGVLFGCEDKAEQLFEQMVNQSKDQSKN